MTDADRFHIPPTQPAGVDIGPLVAIIDREMQRLRDKLFVEESAARSAREALAACEARLRATLERTAELEETRLTMQRIEQQWCIEGDYAPDSESDERHPIERRLAGMAAMHKRDLDRLTTQLEHARGDAKDAQQMLMDERRRTQVPRVELTPGSTAAVIEAYRLLVGNTLEWIPDIGWHDESWAGDDNLNEATISLIHWLDEHAPGGKP